MSENPLNSQEKAKHQPSEKQTITLMTQEGFDASAEYNLMQIAQEGSFVNKAGIETVNIDRFNIREKAKVRVQELIESLPKSGKKLEVNLRYGGVTELTILTAVELIKRGIDVNFQRYNKDTKQYETFYTEEGNTPDKLKRLREQNDMPYALKRLGTMHRHDYPQDIEYIFNLGTVQRDYYPKGVQGYIFNPQKDEVKPHPEGGKGVSLDFKSAPQETLDRMAEMIPGLKDKTRIDLYYSGMTEVTIIALFQLVNAGKEVALMGYNKDKTHGEPYEATLVVAPFATDSQ